MAILGHYHLATTIYNAGLTLTPYKQYIDTDKKDWLAFKEYCFL